MNKETLENLNKFLPEATAFEPKALADLFALADAVDAIQRRISRLAEDTGMQAQHFFVLEQLALSGGASPLGELVHTLNLPKQSATYIVDRLEEEGYVERRKDQRDRRRYEVVLTAKGRRKVKAELAGFYEKLLGALSATSAKERATTLRSLEGFRDALETE